MQELNELKNLVIQSLEANGSLSNIRAQIRASVFKVIDQSDTPAAGPKKPSPFSWENPKCQSLLQSQYGLLCLQLIKEFFQFYQMDYSGNVFSSESNIREAVKREQLTSQLPLTQVDQNSSLLLQILEQLQKKQGQNVNDNKNAQVQPSNIKAEPGQQVNANNPAPKSTSEENKQKNNTNQKEPQEKDIKTDDKFEKKDLENKNKADLKPIEKNTVNAVEDLKIQEDQKQEKELPGKKENKDLSPIPQVIETEDKQSKNNQLKDANKKEVLKDVAVVAPAVVDKNLLGRREDERQVQHSDGEDYEENEHVEEQLDQYEDDEGIEDVDIDGDVQYQHQHRQFEEESEDFIGQSSKGQDLSVDSYEIEQYDLVIGVDDF